MKSPFPGMDPYLEHPSLWPDVHNRLIAAIADDLAGRVAPRYYIALERRTYLFKPDDVLFIGRPDVAVVTGQVPQERAVRSVATAARVLEVDVPVSDEVSENFLEVHEVKTGKLVTILELLSPANKVHSRGREEYEQKRDAIFRSRTSLVEVDLLRDGEPMSVVGPSVQSDYRILVSRGWRRPRAQLLLFDLRQPVPHFTLPLLPGDEEPEVDVGNILHALYRRGRFDLRLDYSQPPVPSLSAGDEEWVRDLMEHSG